MAWGSWRWLYFFPGKTYKMNTFFVVLSCLILIALFVSVSEDTDTSDVASVSSSFVHGRRKLLSLEDASSSLDKSAISRRDGDSVATARKPSTSPVPQAVTSVKGKENGDSTVAVKPPVQESKSPLSASNKLQPLLKNNTAELQISGDSKTSIEPNEGAEDEFSPGPKGLSPDAVLRLFYVFVAVGVIILIYILIKLLRLRRRRASRKYRVVAHGDDQEMFPLAADDGDDEEIYNAADHQTQK